MDAENLTVDDEAFDVVISRFGLFFLADLPRALQGEFAGNYRTQFLNTGLVIPATMVLAPISAFGGGVVVIPWESVVLSALLLDPSGSPTNNDLSEAFHDGFAVVAGGKATIKPFGLVGH